MTAVLYCPGGPSLGLDADGGLKLPLPVARPLILVLVHIVAAPLGTPQGGRLAALICSTGSFTVLGCGNCLGCGSAATIAHAHAVAKALLYQR